MRLLKILEQTPGTHGEKEGITFDEWIQVTLELEREAFGQNPPDMIGDRRADFFLAMLHACTEEISEMGDEVGYKTWILNRGWVNTEAFISEAADLLHFVALMLAAIGCTGEQLTTAYLGKVRKNYERQLKGDDGISRKCEGCGRSLDDVGIDHVPTLSDKLATVPVCHACGHVVRSEIHDN